MEASKGLLRGRPALDGSRRALLGATALALGTGLQYHLSAEEDPARAVADGREMAREARRYLLEHPLRTLRLWAKKFALFFNARELFVRDSTTSHAAIPTCLRSRCRASPPSRPWD